MKNSIIIILIIIVVWIIIKKYKTNNITTPSFITEPGNLYAHAEIGSKSREAWQKWEECSGANSRDGCRYFFLPSSANDEFVEIYNNYEVSSTISGVNIAPKKSAVVHYVNGEAIKVKIGEEIYSLIVYKSDAEASVYVNDTTGEYESWNGEKITTDFYSFLVQDKRNSVKNSTCCIIDNNGITTNIPKKIKGRGNISWNDEAKKSFNITFNEPTTIGQTTSKKFSIIANASDTTLLRNKIIYDLSNEVELLYTPNISYIDLYINGIFQGNYIASPKVDIGKNSLVFLENNSDKTNTNFNFLVEVDVWNYQNDTYFVTDNGYNIVLKTPDLDSYDESKPEMKEKYNYIKNTYQKLDNSLYKGTLEELEKICDIDSLATMYLIQEFGKNCDGGFTSTFFTYNAQEEKFYAVPIWDCDAMMGTIDIIKEGYNISTANYKGWLTREATYNGILNPLARPFELQGKTSDGKTFEEICIQKWNEKFVPAINILLGNKVSTEKLKSIDEYAEKYKRTMYNNYVMWNIEWLSPCYSARLDKTYPYTHEGEIQYLKDWIEARSNWMTMNFNKTYQEESQVSYYLTGENLGGFGKISEENKLTQNENGSYSITKSFNANEPYSLIIIDSENQYYKANLYDETTLKYCTIDEISYSAHVTLTEDVQLKITLQGDYFRISEAE